MADHRRTLRHAVAACWALAALMDTAVAAPALIPTVLYDFPRLYAGNAGVGRAAEGADGRVVIATGNGIDLPCGSLLAVDPRDDSVTRIKVDRPLVGCGLSWSLATDAQGILWGTAHREGPAHRGSVFKISAGGNVASVHAFDRTEGYGGMTPVPHDDGSVRLSRTKSTLGKRGQFERLAGPDFEPLVYRVLTRQDGVLGPTSMLAHDGRLYALARLDNPDRPHVIMSIEDTGEVQVLPRFSTTGYLNDDLVDGHDGYFYLTLHSGPDAEQGSVLKVGSDGETTVLHRFTGADGSYPQSAPIRARDGWLYGTCALGGQHNSGVIYRLKPDGSAYEVLYPFDGTRHGGDPRGGLFQSSDGRIYGRTSTGGRGQGVIFRFTPP